MTLMHAALQMILGWHADARPLDPRLLVAARRGDSKALKDLLQLQPNEDDQQSTTTTTSAAATPSISPPDFIVKVDENAAAGHCCCLMTARQPPAAAPAGSFPAAVPVLDEHGVTMEGDSLLHVVAACGDTQEFLDCAKMIVRNKEKKGGAKRLALEAPNNRGDTPLHCAAGAGNGQMISCLAALITTTTDDDNEEARAAVKKAFLRMQNDCGETALHQAIRAAASNKQRQRPAIFFFRSYICFLHLLKMDPELACIPHEDGASPLYLAISLGEFEIARDLYRHSNGMLSYSGPDGRNVLHAAVSRASVETVILLSQLLTSAVLSKLARQRDKENGSTPLHLAASLGGLPSSWLFFAPQVPRPPPGTSPLWPSSESGHGMLARLFWVGLRYMQILPVMLPLVLNANVGMAYQPDKAGLYPIHVAACSGSLYAVGMLLERCPDCATLRDAKGRTLLHVAAEEGRYRVVKYVCQQSQKQSRRARLLSSILNAQDINGDTPLHRAVYAGELRVVWRLIRNQQVRLDVPNKVGMRPIDVSWTTMPLQAYYAWDPRLRIRRTLLSVGAPYGENNRGDLFREKRILSKEDKEMSQNVTAAAQVLALFSVLITTVTFASAFTLPGGYQQAGDVVGTPVLAGPKSYAFDAFILSDTLAFVCSLSATSLLLYAGVPYGTLTNRFMLINTAYTLMWHAARSLVAAFALGLYVVLLPVARTIAIAIGVLMITSVFLFLKASEGIDLLGRTSQRRQRSKWGTALALILHYLDRFWSYIIIFGLPAIRRWARLP